MKAKSSAILIALLIGSLLTVLISVTALANQRMLGGLSDQKDEQKAELAAMGAVQTGQFEYEKAISSSSEPFTSEAVLVNLAEDIKSNYKIKMDSLSYGQSFNNSAWLSDPYKAIEQEALVMNNNDELKIDLEYLFSLPSKNRPTKIDIKVSNAFKQSEDKIIQTGQTGTFDYKLKNNSAGKELSSASAKIGQSHLLKVENLDACQAQAVSCELFIRLSGMGDSEFAFAKIEAKARAKKISPTGEKPGTIVIEGEGIVGKTRAKMEAKYENLGGKFLGIFKI